MVAHHRKKPPGPTGLTTLSGVPIPAGWNRVRLDTFGTTKSIPDFPTLHKYYRQGQYYNLAGDDTLSANPINGQQQTYTNFEDGYFVFSSDHLTIQARGAAGPIIHSGQMSSRYSSRSMIVEARFTAPGGAGSWTEFWGYPIMAAAPYTAAFTGSMSGTTLTVTVYTSGYIQYGLKFPNSNGITSDTWILDQLTSTEAGGTLGGRGTYTISQSWSLSSRAFTASAFDRSELDVELVIGAPDGSHPAETVHNVSLGNFRSQGFFPTNMTIYDADFTTTYWFWTKPAFDMSTGPHYYTIYFDDSGSGTIRRYIDGNEIYTGTMRWMEALITQGISDGITDMNATIDLAIGGVFPGSLTNAQMVAYSGNLDIYSIEIFSPLAVPTTQAWDQSHKSGSVVLSSDSLTATARSFTYAGFADQNQIVYAWKTGTGRYYWEVVLTGSTSVGVGLGITGPTPSIVLNGNYLGGLLGDTLGWFGDGNVYNTNGWVATVATYAPASGVRLCLAVDLVSHKLWLRVGATGLWNNAVLSSQNPSTSSQVGGIALPVVLQTNTVPAIELFHAGDTAVGAFVQASWLGTAPTGFGEW